ncbi:choice-of-anchor J domain-containing protein [Mariniflexile sp.]|uniref:choice-of-anchor J domain-containing protein n=1 Tax=Mariniflexile sp. TaxID=1979402 RepID=UPI0035655E7B
MRNKLHNAVAKNNFFFFKEDCEFKSKTHKRNFQSGSFIFVITLMLSLLLTGKGFAQVSENFDSGVPSSWTIFGNGVGTSNWGLTRAGYQNTNGVSINPSADNIGDQNTAQYFLVSPQILTPSNGEIHFYTKQTSQTDNGAIYQVRISTASQPDINGFSIVLQSYTEANLNVGSQTAYEKKIIKLPSSIPAGLQIYIAFVAVNTQQGVTPTGDEWFVDNFSVLEGCTEVDSDDVTIDGITIDGADISWSHPTATNFELQVLPEGGTPAGGGIPVTGTSYTLTNLDEDTEFDVYIRSICDNETYSEWTGPFNFKTLKLGLTCESPIVISDLSSESFVLSDNLANYINPEVTYTSQGTNCISGTSTTNYLRGDKVFLSYTPTEDGLLTLTQTTFSGGNATNNCYNSRSSLFVYEGCNAVGVNCLAGVNTLNGFDPKTISNLLVEAGKTYIIVVSSELSSGAGICFELEVSSPKCAPPGKIVYNNLTENSVAFSWDNIGGFASSWEYVVVPTNSGEPTGSGTVTNSNVNNVINTGLAPATTYDLYVRSVCGGVPGTWGEAFTFKTQCTVFETPYATSFATASSTNPEACWTTIDVNGDGNSWGFIGGYATVRTDLSRYQNHDMYVSPQINFNGVQKRLKYKHRATQGSSSYTVKLSTTGVGVDNFTTIVVPERLITNTTFQEVMIDLPAGITGNVNIAWIVQPNNSESALRLSIDDVVIEDKPTCPDPKNPFVLSSSITTNSAWLFWTKGESETQWQVAIQNEGSGIPTGDGTLVTSNSPFIANNLNSGVRYEFYVRAYCDSDDQSNWVGPVAFTTLCTSYNTPFFESFNDDDADTQKFCWQTSNGDWTISENMAEIPAGSPYNDYLISPAINVNGVKELKFKYRAEVVFSFGTLSAPRFGLEVLMSTTNNSPGSFSVISPLEVFTHSGYKEKSIIIEANGPVYIAFRVPPEFTGAASKLNIDDVSITDAPPCPNPSSLNLDTVLTDGAILSWSAGYQETEWNVVVQPAGSGIPSGFATTVTTNSYTATDLSSDTEYEFYVMSNCANGDSEWAGPLVFKTACTPFVTPFTESFNSDSTSESCWTVIDGNTNLKTWELNSGAFPYEGDQAAAIFSGSNGNNNDWLISPTITIKENQRLRYYYRVNDSFFTEDLEVLLSTNGTGLEQFTTVLYDSEEDPVLINNVEYKVKIINFPAGITGDVNIAFHVPFFQSSAPYRGQTLVIDNVNIEDVPLCPEITNISFNNITDTQVQVSWDANGTESPWEISVQPAGTAAPVGDTDPNYLYSATSNPFTVTGLTASSMYDVYVRSLCETGEMVWVGPKQVTTKCSFENLCLYTFTLFSNSDVSSTLDITQNNQVTQSLDFNGRTEGESFDVLLCSGVEFSLFFNTIGTYAPQYANYSFEIRDDQGTLVYASTEAMMPRTKVYTGYSSCGVITCPTPTDLAVSTTSVLSWTPGANETQWEVAIQPVGNGTIPQTGTLVSTASYTPTSTDFSNPFAATYEYFVRAVCGTDDKSFWAGPFVFVRNDDVSNALVLPINGSEVCEDAGTKVSFVNATASSEAMSCEATNGGDVWFSITAESPIHIFEINNFSGSLRGEINSLPAYPEITMTLYKDNGSGSLQELACSYDNVLVAMYASELVVGENYKLRLTLNGTEPNIYDFNVCVKTPVDLCDFNLAVNGGFEEPVIPSLSGVTTIISLRTLPGWRQNIESVQSTFVWESLNAPGFTSYEGGQVVQLLTEQVPVGPEDTDIKGLYRDFDTSEVTLLEYSFAHYARFSGNTVQLYAGPVGGPYSLITTHVGEQEWDVISGEFEVPAGQNTTRVIFRVYGENTIGNLLDAVSFRSNNDIITQPYDIDCTNPVATVAANGVGTWIANENNPSPVTFTDANSNTTSITGFLKSGIYTFTWKTSYCEEDIEILYDGIGYAPTVESPIEYCQNDIAEPLAVTIEGDYTLLWYSQAEGGTGTTTAPTPNTSVSGSTTYYVAYTDTRGCVGPRAEIVVNVGATIPAVVNFSYDTTCTNSEVAFMPVLAEGFSVGGTFSSTTLTVDPTTGEIELSEAAAGAHEVVYTFDGDPENCIQSGIFTANVQIILSITPVTDFYYTDAVYCASSANAVPVLENGFTTGGTFSASSGLALNSETGEVNISGSAFGNYTITYTINEDAANCVSGSVSTYDIAILSSIEAEVTESCESGETILTVLPVNNSFDPYEVTYTWMDANGAVIGDNSEIFNVSDYAAMNPNVTVPTQIMVQVEYGDCSSIVTTTLNKLSCGSITRGISPGNDNKNDSLDLTGYGVIEIAIFNRFGVEVYAFKGNYTNQWHGQSKKGDDLPDATYFYTIRKQDGSASTGWIYINREN